LQCLSFWVFICFGLRLYIDNGLMIKQSMIIIDSMLFDYDFSVVLIVMLLGLTTVCRAVCLNLFGLFTKKIKMARAKNENRFDRHGSTKLKDFVKIGPTVTVNVVGKKVNKRLIVCGVVLAHDFGVFFYVVVCWRRDC
jgi:hypothetical protein